MIRRHGRTGGFTLIEVLVVIGIFGVVTAIGSSTFVSITSAWHERKSIAELDAQAEVALESIREDLSATLSYAVSGVAIQGTTGDVSDTRTYPAARHRNDSLSIPVQAIDPNRPVAVPATIGYRIERAGDSGTGILVRTVGALDGGFPTTNRLELLPRARVLGFSVEFLSGEPGAVWVDGWSADRMPAAVRISLAIEDIDRPNQFQVTRKLVVPVHVQ